MTGLILKLSFNNVGETPVTGGICGSFFFLRNNIAITANHLLNHQNFKPNDGFLKCQYWLLVGNNTVIELKIGNLIDVPEIDTTIIKLNKDYDVQLRKVSTSEIKIGQACHNDGFIGGQMPVLSANWGQNGLIISGFNINNVIANGKGSVKRILNLEVNANDVKLQNILGLETSYGGIIGMSGGPLINTETNEIIGLMSIGLPADVQTKLTLFAVDIKQIMEKIKNVA